VEHAAAAAAAAAGPRVFESTTRVTKSNNTHTITRTRTHTTRTHMLIHENIHVPWGAAGTPPQPCAAPGAARPPCPMHPPGLGLVQACGRGHRQRIWQKRWHICTAGSCSPRSPVRPGSPSLRAPAPFAPLLALLLFYKRACHPSCEDCSLHCWGVPITTRFSCVPSTAAVAPLPRLTTVPPPTYEGHRTGAPTSPTHS